MITEDLKTFIAKMRAAGKTDLEITAELKTAGWVENDINLALSEKPIHPFFSPRPLWSLLMIIPIVVSGLMVLATSGFMLAGFENFRQVSNPPFGVPANIFAEIEAFSAMMLLILTTGLITSALFVLQLIYIFINRQKFVKTTDEAIIWVLLILSFGIFTIPYIHFRYLRGWSARKAGLFIGSIIIVTLAIFVVQFVRFNTAFSSLRF